MLRVVARISPTELAQESHPDPTVEFQGHAFDNSPMIVIPSLDNFVVSNRTASPDCFKHRQPIT